MALRDDSSWRTRIVGDAFRMGEQGSAGAGRALLAQELRKAQGEHWAQLPGGSELVAHYHQALANFDEQFPPAG